MKVKITKSNRDTYWYAKSIGDVYEVTGPKNGSYKVVGGLQYIDVDDCVVEKFLEDAWDGPVAATYDKTRYYTYPAAKEIIVKKTIEQLAIEVLQNTTGKIYTEREIIAVVSIVKTLKELEGM